MKENADSYSLLILFCIFIFKGSPENVLIVWCVYDIHLSLYSLFRDLWFAWRLSLGCLFGNLTSLYLLGGHQRTEKTSLTEDGGSWFLQNLHSHLQDCILS